MWLIIKFPKSRGAVISVVYRKLISAAPPYPNQRPSSSISALPGELAVMEIVMGRLQVKGSTCFAS